MKLPSNKSKPSLFKGSAFEFNENPVAKEYEVPKFSLQSPTPMVTSSISYANPTTITSPFRGQNDAIPSNSQRENSNLKSYDFRPTSAKTLPGLQEVALNIPPSTGDEENFKLLMNQSIMRMDNLRDFLLTNRPSEAKVEIRHSNNLSHSGVLNQLDRPLSTSGVKQFLKSPLELPLNASKGLQQVSKVDTIGYELVLLFLEKVEILRLNEKLKFRIFDENKSEGSSKGLNTLRTHNERLAREVAHLKSELGDLKSQNTQKLKERNKELERLLEEVTEELSKAQGEVYSLKTELDNNSFGSTLPFGNRTLDLNEIARLKKEYEKTILDLGVREKKLQRRLEDAEEASRRAEKTRLSDLTSNQIVLNSQRDKISELSAENLRMKQELQRLMTQPKNLSEPLKNALQELIGKVLPSESPTHIYNAVNDESLLIPLIRKTCNSPILNQPVTSSLASTIRRSNVVYVNDTEPLSVIRTDKNSVSPQRVLEKAPQTVVVSYQKVLPATISAVQERPSEIFRNSQVTGAMNLRILPKPSHQQRAFFADVQSGQQITNILSDKSDRDFEEKVSQSHNEKKFERLSLSSSQKETHEKARGNLTPNIKSSRHDIETFGSLSVERKERTRKSRSGFKDDFDDGPVTDLKSELLRLKNKILNLESKAKGSIRQMNDISGITNNGETTLSFTHLEISPNTTRI